jgi:hypothetical protein
MNTIRLEQVTGNDTDFKTALTSAVFLATTIAARSLRASDFLNSSGKACLLPCWRPAGFPPSAHHRRPS